MVLVISETSQLLFETVVNVPIFQVVQIFPVVVQRPIPMVRTVCRTTGIPLFFFDPVLQGVQVVVLLPWCRGQFPWSRLCVGPLNFPVAGHGDRCPCCSGYAVRLFPCRGAEAASHGLSDHGVSSVSRWQGDRLPVVQVVRVLLCRRGGDSRLRCVDRLMRHEACSPCAQAQGQGLTTAIRAGKGWRGRRESDSQVTCHPIHCMRCGAWTERSYKLNVRTTTTTTTTPPPPPPPPTHQPTNHPTHQPTNPPTHQPTTHNPQPPTTTHNHHHRPRSKHTRFLGVRCRLFCVALFGTFMWSQVHGEHVSAARRRRERRLRQFLRHERVSVAMALAESNHHAAPRGQKMARAGRVEREENYEPRLLDPPLPQTAATVGYVAAAGPLLVVPSLAGGDSVDVTTAKFLLRNALRELEEEENLEERDKAHAHLKAMTELVRRRKKKKRRKRKTPKSSSFRSSSGVRPRRCGQGSRSRSSSSGGCGRLREHVRQVPAVADLQWKVPPSISSTKWWTFQLCYGDRYGCLQVQFSDKVVSLPGVVLRLALLVQRVQKLVEFPQVQFLDKVLFLPGIVPYRPLCRLHWCSSWRRRSSSSLSCAKADPHGPGCFSRPRRFPRCTMPCCGKKFFLNVILGADCAAQPYFVAIITPVIHYFMGGLEVDEEFAVGLRLSGHPRSSCGG